MYHWEISKVNIDRIPEVNLDTLPETNIAPKNGWLEYYFPIGMAYFQGRTAVSFREGKFLILKSFSIKDFFRDQS